MNREILDSAIAYAFENAIRCGRKGVNVSFAVGGEPISQWELFKYCVDALNRAKQQNQLQLLLSMTTNGYYGDEKRDFIVKNVKNILLSLDGPPEFQNTQRPTQAGNASFPVVMATAKYFAREQSSLSIRVTVSNRSVSRLEDMVCFFHDELGTKLNIVFEPLVPIGRAQHPMGGIEPPKLQDFVDNFIRAKERGCQYGINVTTSSANIKRLVTGFCGAMTIPSFTVTTTGKVTTCERDSDGTAYCYGEYVSNSHKFVFDEGRIAANRKLIELPVKCNDCFCKWHCAGDCPDVRLANYDRCECNRRLVRHELLSLLDGKDRDPKKGGEITHDQFPNECMPIS